MRDQSRVGGPKIRRWMAATAGIGFLLFYLVVSLFPIFWIVISSVKRSVDTLAMPPVWWFRPTLNA